jgi:hypothetical protein
MSDFWNIWASNSLNWLSKWQESKVGLRFLKVYLHFTWMSRKWRPKFFGRHSRYSFLSSNNQTALRLRQLLKLLLQSNQERLFELVILNLIFKWCNWYNFLTAASVTSNIWLNIMVNLFERKAKWGAFWAFPLVNF